MLNDSVSGQRSPWSDCASAQSDLGLRHPFTLQGHFFARRDPYHVKKSNTENRMRAGAKPSRGRHHPIYKFNSIQGPMSTKSYKPSHTTRMRSLAGAFEVRIRYGRFSVSACPLSRRFKYGFIEWMIRTLTSVLWLLSANNTLYCRVKYSAILIWRHIACTHFTKSKNEFLVIWCRNWSP